MPSPKAEPVKQWLAKVGARRLEEITQPLPPASVSAEIATLPEPPEMAPALDWARYYERLAALYRRQAAYEAQFADMELRQDALENRMETVEEISRLVPEILERLGPETLTPEHQASVQAGAKRLHEVGGFAFATIYGELGTHFHVAKYDQIPEARWHEVAEWFRIRIEAAEQRKQGQC